MPSPLLLQTPPLTPPLILDRGQTGKALYVQLVNHFRGQILNGELPPGSQLPTEWELVEQFGVSRNTVRQAMATLVDAELLERTQGRGTFVRAAQIRRADSPSETQSKGCDQRIGLILGHSGDQLNMEILMGVGQAAKSRGYEVSVTFSDEDEAQQKRDVARLRAGGACGFIIFPLSDTDEDPAMAQLISEGVPLVLVDRYLPKLPTDFVGADNYNGGYRATEHLIILGHKRIGFVHERVGSLRTASVHDRWRGYRQAMQDYDVVHDPQTVFSTSEAAILKGSDRPTALFAANDDTALHFLNVASGFGLRVPNDLAIVGFDDLTYVTMSNPPLTTIAQPRLEVGIRAGHLLLDRIEGLRGAIKHIELPTHLVVRESCGAKLRVRNFAH